VSFSSFNAANFEPLVTRHCSTSHSSTHFAVKVDDGANTDELGSRVLVQDREEDICDQVNALLHRPATDEHK